MKTAYDSMEVMQAMLKNGLQSSLSDAGVGILCARAAVIGAYFNVRINAKDIKDKTFANTILKDAKDIYDKTIAVEQEMMSFMDTKI
jgi:glutamate formiminotransferase/formiminotetrahydrofolate cyclodeaminase